MQIRHWILIASLLGNAAILAAIVNNSNSLARDKAAVSPIPVVQSTTGGSGIFSKAKKASKNNPADPATTPAPTPAFHWRQIESEDYKKYVANLREAGCPERTIRDIILADIQKLYQPRIAAIVPKPPEKYWERKSRFGPVHRQTKEQRQERAAILEEMQQLAKSLLGDDVYEKHGEDQGDAENRDPLDKLLGPLGDDQKKALKAMQEDYQDARMNLYEKANGYVDRDTQIALRAASRQFEEQLAAFLTPEQVENYQLHYSDAANSLRWQLRVFEPTEEEFRALFKSNQAVQDANLANDPDNPPDQDTLKKWNDLRKSAEDDAKQALGGDRMLEYTKLQDYSYQSLADLDVSHEDVLKVVDYRTAAEDAIRQLRQNASLSDDERQAAMQAVVQETQNQLTTLFGERKAKYYANQGGYWIQNLAPRISTQR